MTPPAPPHPTAAEARQRFYDLVHAAENGQDTLLLATSGATVRLTTAPAGTDPTAYPGQTLKWAKAKLEELVEQAAAGQPVLLLRSGSIPAALLQAEPAAQHPAAGEPAAHPPTAPSAPSGDLAPPPAPAAPSGPTAPAPAQAPPAPPPALAAPVSSSGGVAAAPVQAAPVPVGPTPTVPAPAVAAPGTAGDALVSLATAPEPVRFALQALDKVAGGLPAGTVTLLAAEPGAGGSLLALAPARATALHENRPVLYAATGGLARTDVATRMVAAEVGADYRSLRQTLTATTAGEDVSEAVTAATEAVTAAPLHLMDGPLTAEAITGAGAGIEGLALLVVDRLQRQVDPAAPLSGRTPLREAVHLLARFAREKNLPVLAVLDTTDLHVVGALNPDRCLTLTRDGQRAHVRVAERDFGLTGTVPLTTDLTCARFLPATEATEDTGTGGEGGAPHLSPAGGGREGRVWPPPGFKQPETSEAAKKAPLQEVISTVVQEELERADGDPQAALAALEKRSIREVIALQNRCRVKGRLDYSFKPPMPAILQREEKGKADEVWEARHNWTNPRYTHRGKQEKTIEVTPLDLNAAYLNVLQCHLPIGALVHSTSGEHVHGRSGMYLVTPPEWPHTHLPNPMGAREEPGPVWITESTLRLLFELSRPKDEKRKMCEEPIIHESWTSGSSEGLLKKLRDTLNTARTQAIDRGDELTKEFVSDMYVKFVSTLIPSAANDWLDRPDWAHIIRAQAYANLWRRARLAHEAGLTVARVARTDELHLIGDWQSARRPDGSELWKGGRGLAEIKVKKKPDNTDDIYYVREVA